MDGLAVLRHYGKGIGNVPDQDLMPMLQALLVERFHIGAERESRRGRFSHWLSIRAGRTVIDKTGLTGDFEIELVYLPLESMNGAPESELEIFRAVRN
jgi:hypothetical protein